MQCFSQTQSSMPGTICLPLYSTRWVYCLFQLPREEFSFFHTWFFPVKYLICCMQIQSVVSADLRYVYVCMWRWQLSIFGSRFHVSQAFNCYFRTSFQVIRLWCILIKQTNYNRTLRSHSFWRFKVSLTIINFLSRFYGTRRRSRTEMYHRRKSSAYLIP